MPHGPFSFSVPKSNTRVNLTPAGMAYLLREVKRLDLTDLEKSGDALQRRLPADGDFLLGFIATVIEAVNDGTLAVTNLIRGSHGASILLPDDSAHALSCDATINDGFVTPHRYPNGAVMLFYGLSGHPTLNGRPVETASWHAHQPRSGGSLTLSGGKLLIITFLPEGKATVMEGRYR